MANPPYAQPSYYYGIPDMFLQMGYVPYSRHTAGEQPDMHVDIPLATAMAMQGKYYLGQTEKLTAGSGVQAWGALVNPYRSGIQVYVNDWFLTNRADHPVEVHIWLGKANQLGTATASRQVTPGSIQLPPCPDPKGQILYASATTEMPRDGVIASTRILPPRSTTAAEKSGRWILGPGTALLFHIPAEVPSSELTVAFGWWEQPVYG